jgi:hypothetical protein
MLQTNATDWLRVNMSQQFPGTAIYGPVAVGSGGLSVGSWEQLAPGYVHVTERIGIGMGAGGPGAPRVAVAGAIESAAVPTGDVNSAGLILRDETTGTRWQLHSHGDALRMWNGTFETIVGSQSSSVRYKQRVAPLEGALGLVSRMRPVSFDFRPGIHGGRHGIGFLAEELVGVVPEVVWLDSGGQPMAIDYGVLSTIAIQGMKELQEAAASDRRSLEQENAALRTRLEALEARLRAIEARSRDAPLE